MAVYTVTMRVSRSVMAVAIACAALSMAADFPTEQKLVSPERIVISGGRFVMGLDDAGMRDALSLCAASKTAKICTAQDFGAEQPAHTVYVSRVAIDRTEVSRQDYELCRAALRCPPPRVADHDVRLSDPSFPVSGVTFEEAARYCAYVGGRLPTEAEWEKAARAGSSRRFPWGRYFNSRVANHGPTHGTSEMHDGFAYAAPVTAFADGRSAYGVLNMAGNVWELTADYFDAGYYRDSAEVDPQGPATGKAHVIRGGSFLSPAQDLRVTARSSLPDGDTKPDVGFRCAYDVRDADQP